MLLNRRLFSTISLGKLLVFGAMSKTILVSEADKYLLAEETQANEPISPTTQATATTQVRKANQRADEFDYLRVTDAEWKKRLTPAQFEVARRHGTERPYSGKYHNDKKDGAYRCVCCKTLIFDARHKFDSGTGWPSFWKPLDEEVVGESQDIKLGYPRTEVHCKRCNAHLGHIFNDAPKTPTGLRYCINSVCLVFATRKEVEQIAAQR